MPKLLKKNMPSILLILFAFLVILVTPSQVPDNSHSLVGPRAIPYFACSAIILLSAAQIVKDIKEFRANPETPIGWKIERKALLKVFGVFICLVAWTLFTPVAGFLVTTFFFTLITMLIIGNRNPVSLILIPVCLTASVYYVFVKLLYITF